MVWLGGKYLRNISFVTLYFTTFPSLQIPQSTEGKFWFHYVDKNVNSDLLEQLTREFLVIYEKSPARLKTKLNSCKGLVLNKVSVLPLPFSERIPFID